jgi:PD-(D/E)XK nuclease superfamily protein
VRLLPDPFLLLKNGVNMELQDAIWVGDIVAATDTRKWSGEQAEAAFLHKATGLGLSVLTPWGDSERYDLVVGTGKRLLRVQVKSTRYVGEKRYSITARGCTAPYTADEIDFLAVYIVPLDLWYIIPVKAFSPRKCLKFYPGGGGRYEKYREAWWRLGADSAER